MYFAHSPAIWRQFPQLVPGVLVVDGIRANVDAAALFDPWYERARQRLRDRAESDLPEVSAWRRAYAQMGLKPTQYRSAAEALLRRFRREGALPRVHPLVDLCNALSLAFSVPMAVLDLARVASYVEVRHATGDEVHLAWSGDEERPDPGEVIFADAANHAHARRWTFRQSRRSTVSADTRRALIVAEGLHATAPADIPALVAALARDVAALSLAPREPVVLTAVSPRLEFSADGA